MPSTGIELSAWVGILSLLNACPAYRDVTWPALKFAPLLQPGDTQSRVISLLVGILFASVYWYCKVHTFRNGIAGDGDGDQRL